jgi:hypothetical protein
MHASTPTQPMIKEYSNISSTVNSYSNPNSSKKVPISLPMSINSSGKQNSRKNLLSNKIYYNGKPKDTPKLGMSEIRQKSGKINLIPAPAKNSIRISSNINMSSSVNGSTSGNGNGIGRDSMNLGKSNQKNNFLQNQNQRSLTGNLNNNNTNNCNNYNNFSHTYSQSNKTPFPSNPLNFSKNSLNFSNSPGKRINKVNLHFHKEIILNPESSIAEKYESLMHIRFTSGFFHSQEVENIIKSLLESLDLDTEFNQVNTILFIDVLNMVLVNRYFDMLPLLEKMQKNFEKICEKNSLNSQNEKNIFNTSNSILNKELINTIHILTSIQESFKKTIIVNSELNIQLPIKPVKRDPRLDISLNKSRGNNHNNNHRNGNRNSRSHNKLKYHNSYNQVNSIPQIKHITRYFDTDKNSENLIHTDGNSDASHSQSQSQSQSYINYYPQPQQLTRNFLDGYSEHHTVNDESCNIADSSWSMARYDEPRESGDQLQLQFVNTVSNSNVDNSNRTRTEEVKCEIKLQDENAMPVPVAPDKKVETSFFDN